MKKSLFFVIAAMSAALFAVSCKDDVTENLPGENAVGEGQISFTAYIADEGTRSSMDGRSVVWNTGDEIRVFTANHTEGLVYTLASGAGTASGTFTGPTIGSGPFYAVYPADAASSMSGSSMSIAVSLPTTQAWAAGSFGPGANVSCGYATEINGIKFRNVLGALALTISGTGKVGSVTVYTEGDELLAGTGTLSGLDGTPALQMVGTRSGVNCKAVKLDCGTSGADLTAAGTTFYVMLPAGTLDSGYNVVVADTEGNAMLKRSASGHTPAIERNVIRPMPALSYTAAYKAAFLNHEGAGAFSGAGASSSSFTECCVYTEGESQYSWVNVTSGKVQLHKVRLQDMEDGFALTITTPKTLTVGGNASTKIEVMGNTGAVVAGTSSMKVVRKFDGRVWLYDSNSDFGYITFEEE